MDSNKDEARRAKAMAEMRLQCNDLIGAISFARRARTLDPELDDGLSQMLSMLDVYISGARRVGGEADWYGVLGVDPTADEETIKKQYRKLALTLHPDKNPLKGAEGAFKLVSEAKCLLLDREKRSAFDRLAGYQVPFDQGVSTEAGEPSARGGADAPAANAHSGGPREVPSGSRPAAPTGCARPPTGGPTKHPCAPADEPLGPDSMFKAKVKCPKTEPQPGKNTSDLFWTICQRCRLYFEYRSIFRNIVIRCARCQNAFTAVEVPRPVSKSQTHVPRPWPIRQQWGQMGAPPTPRPPFSRTYPDGPFTPGASMPHANGSRAQTNAPSASGTSKFPGDHFFDFPNGSGKAPGPSDEFEAGNPTETAAEEEDEAAAFLRDMLDDGAMDSIFKRRRMDEDDGDGQGGASGNNRNVAEPTNADSKKAGSIYACW